MDAKANFSKIVKLLESGKEESVIISRYGKPVVKVMAYNDAPVSKRIGAAKGKLKSPEDFDQDNGEIGKLFESAF